jgi:putative Holliday junction resolvase
MPDTPEAGRPETVLAFDFGLRRIGLAVGQDITMSASPVGTVANSARGPDHREIRRQIREWRPTKLVVGLPLQANGSPSKMQHKVDAFIKELGRYRLPIVTVDERYTSREAEAALKRARAAGRRGQTTKAAIDSAAAVLIAERYLTSRPEATITRN